MTVPMEGYMEDGKLRLLERLIENGSFDPSSTFEQFAARARQLLDPEVFEHVRPMLPEIHARALSKASTE
jgi:hypothetical protein